MCSNYEQGKMIITKHSDQKQVICTKIRHADIPLGGMQQKLNTVTCQNNLIISERNVLYEILQSQNRSAG
jgi:hypothetical protein